MASGRWDQPAGTRSKGEDSLVLKQQSGRISALKYQRTNNAGNKARKWHRIKDTELLGLMMKMLCAGKEIVVEFHSSTHR